MTWDKTKPQGSEVLKLGDDRIRELKQDIETLLTYEHYFELDQDNNIVDVQHKVPIGFPTTDKVDGRLCYVPQDETLYVWDASLNTWRRLSAPYNLIPVGTKIIGCINGAGWQLVNLQTTYCVRLVNDYNESGIVGGQNDFYDLNHQHTVSVYLYSHNHQLSGFSTKSSGEKCDTYGWDKGTWSSDEHRHPFSLTLNSQTLQHSHTIDIQGGLISTGFLGIYERVY